MSGWGGFIPKPYLYLSPSYRLCSIIPPGRSVNQQVQQELETIHNTKRQLLIQWLSSSISLFWRKHEQPLSMEETLQVSETPWSFHFSDLQQMCFFLCVCRERATCWRRCPA